MFIPFHNFVVTAKKLITNNQLKENILKALAVLARALISRQRN